MMASWRPSTQKQYSTYLKKWEKFCHEKNINTSTPSINCIIDFLSSLFYSGLGYSAINSAKSALSSFLVLEGGGSVGNHPLVTRFMKGVFNLKPSLPRYSTTWDVQLILKFYCDSDHMQMTFKALSFRVAIFLAILSTQRLQILVSLKTQNMLLKDNGVVFFIDEILKTSRPGKHMASFTLPSFSENPNLCIVSLLKHYKYRTLDLRPVGEERLLISFVKPHKAISTDTLARWIKEVLFEVGVDVKIFSAHSTRAASASAALSAGAPIETILRAGNWASITTFANHYNKPVCSNDNLASNLLRDLNKEAC